MNKLSIDNHYINAKVQYKKFFSQRDITIIINKNYSSNKNTNIA